MGDEKIGPRFWHVRASVAVFKRLKDLLSFGRYNQLMYVQIVSQMFSETFS